MEAGHFFRLTEKDLIKLPCGSEIFTLHGRNPLGFDRARGKFVCEKRLFAAAAFISPGHTVTYNAAYIENKRCGTLPLFSYAALAYAKGQFYASAVRVDKDIRHDIRFLPLNKVKEKIKKFRKVFPKNRLIRHLEDCAIRYGCANAKNFFLSRFEAPLPISPVCNARCAGCISFQKGKIPVTQPRIKFTPTPDEIAEIALYHISRARDPVVSFGQGCEGEPLLQGGIIEKAVKKIRAATRQGFININTNGSRPETLERLFNAGLNSARISLNSAREKYYNLYYRPKGYSFYEVCASMSVSKKYGGFVSLNYLVMPGFTDTVGEYRSLLGLVNSRGIDMIQWRNLNYDPVRYFKIIGCEPEPCDIIGMRTVINGLKKAAPNIKSGYFNPSLDIPMIQRAA